MSKYFLSKNSTRPVRPVDGTQSRVRRLTQMSLLAAISIVLIMLLRLSFFPSAPYLEYDMADVPVLLGTFLLGPAAGLEILFVVSAIQAFFLGGNGIIGLIMHFVASGAMILAVWAVYRALGKKTSSLIAGLATGTLVRVLIMIPLNLILTVHFSGVPRQAVVDMLMPVLIPFNLLVAGINSIIFFIVYKAVGAVLQTIMTGKKSGK